MRNQPIPGHDYRIHADVAHTAEVWQQIMAAFLKDGGWRRVEHGETFIHGSGGRIVAEVYANIPAPIAKNE